MAARENVFLRSGSPVHDEAESLQRLLELEPIPDTTGAREDQYGLRGPARTVDGVLGFVVQPNHHVEVDPGPEDIQALDGYTMEIDIWLGRDTVVQQREARLVFDRLVEARPGVPMLLCHDLDLLVAAYLPGRGVHEFPEGTTMDAPDADCWRPWVPE
ncbi:hypothetical protein [Kribbella sp.]|uniref:hypothetical protein n=1 Tax=Kribbella sp. TaxID=1871183 RepID=UPI002D79DA59|nr:hypothetical protein [Kribbella sp.]